MLLTDTERAICAQIANRDEVHGRRAAALIALDAGLSQQKAAARAGISRGSLRYWLAQFAEERMGIFPEEILGEPQPEQIFTEPEIPPSPKSPGLQADDTVARAIQKLLGFYFARMVAHEPGTRTDDDPEELHDMRVATRRMRAVLRLFDDYVDMIDVKRPKVIKRLNKELKRTARVLGRVRDLDVFAQKTEAYLAEHEDAGDIAPLMEIMRERRERAREDLLAYMDGPDYADLKAEFAAFLETPDPFILPDAAECEQPLPVRVRHVAPILIYQRLAAVRAYDEWVTRPGVSLERLHRLRIAFKALRYTLEFFQEILGPEAADLIRVIKSMQDHLGNLQDAVVASEMLRDFLIWGTWAAHDQYPSEIPEDPVIAPEVATYLAVKQNDIKGLWGSFPEAWRTFHEGQVRRLVAMSVIKL